MAMIYYKNSYEEYGWNCKTGVYSLPAYIYGNLNLTPLVNERFIDSSVRETIVLDLISSLLK